MYSFPCSLTTLTFPVTYYFLENMFHFRRKEIPWEVVDSKAVDPVPLYYEFEDDGVLLSCSDDQTG
jgi:hypothetical protein